MKYAFALFSGFLQGASVSDKPETPFKLATFEIDGKTRIGMILNDRILDLDAANKYVARQAGLQQVALPTEMRELIERRGVGQGRAIYRRADGSKGERYLTPTPAERLYQIANYLHDKKADSLSFAFALDKVSIKAPIKYPDNLLNMAANYWSHAKEMGVKKDVDPD